MISLLYLKENEAAILILDENGVEVTNQTGGYACNQQVAKASAIYFTTIPESVRSIFTTSPYNGWCTVEYGGITKTVAAALEYIEVESFRNFEPNMDMLDQSEEAWIHGFYKNKPCILTFSNSD